MENGSVKLRKIVQFSLFPRRKCCTNNNNMASVENCATKESSTLHKCVLGLVLAFFFWVDFDKDIRIFEGFFSDDFLHNPEIWNLCGEAHFANHKAYNLNNLAINIILEFSVIFKGFFIIMRKAINIFCLRYLGPIWSEPLILFNRSVFFSPSNFKSHMKEGYFSGKHNYSLWSKNWSKFGGIFGSPLPKGIPSTCFCRLFGFTDFMNSDPLLCTWNNRKSLQCD